MVGTGFLRPEKGADPCEGRPIKTFRCAIYTRKSSQEGGIDPRFLVRDRDSKYPDIFEAFWKEVEVRPIKIPPRAPMANAFCERYIGTMKLELPIHISCFRRAQLDYVLRVWRKHYHEKRPRRGVGRDNIALDENFVPKTDAPVRCKTERGGIWKSYYRHSA